jgi:hypothetical protein
MQVNIKDAIQIMVAAMKANLVPMIFGSPGSGKSDAIKSIASSFNLELVDVRLGQLDPVDLNGFPYIDKEKGIASYIPMDIFPTENTPLPPGKKGWLLFLDEFNSADRAVQKAAYKLLLDRMVGNTPLHEAVAIIGAGNLITDNAIVEEMSTAVQSRIIHLELSVDNKNWLEWAIKNDIDHRVTSYIRFKPTMLHKFDPNHNEHTFPAPRTWEFASRFLQELDVKGPLLLPALAGTIGLGAAREFVTFLKVYEKLPTFDDILVKGETMRVPTEPSVLFAMTGSIVANTTRDNLETVMKFIKRIPREFQSFTVRDLYKKDSEIMEVKCIQEWLEDTTGFLFDE